MLDFGEPANRREVLGREPQNVLEFGLCLVVAADLEQRAPEGDARGQIRGMPIEPGDAGGDRFLESSGAAVSSASAANAIDAGSDWTRRLSSRIRGLSAIA